MTETGRGAFTKVGKDNEQSFYTYKKNLPQDGLTPEKGFNYEAVNLGVKSIEERLVQLGFTVKVDGIFGPKVTAAVKEFQSQNGITVSGQVGYNTGPALWHGVIEGVGKNYPFPSSIAWGIMKAESGGDPGAVGYLTPGDRGLYQYNTLVHDIDYAQAHDFDWSTEAVFVRLNGAWKKYMGHGPELRIACTIAQHNAPAWADEWFQTGTPPNETIQNYVSRVQGFALTY